MPLEVPAAIAGIWLALVGVYGILATAHARRYRAQEREQTHAIRSSAFSARLGVSTDQPVLGGLFSEVDTLRLQVETLRSELFALTGGPNGEKARLRRYRPGQYTELPRTLRRQVREVRSFRRPIQV